MTQFLQFDQGTPEWLEWRRTHRMASETPAIMGLSSYSTAADVRAAKRGEGKKSTAAMALGNEQEPLARAAFEDYMGLPFKPVCCVSGDYAASLDGLSPDGLALVEIKTIASMTSERAKATAEFRVLDMDMAQIQHQLMVSGAKTGFLWVWFPEKQKGELMVVSPSHGWVERITSAWDAFWPTLAPREDDAWLAAASEYLAAKSALAEAEKRVEVAKEALVGMVGDTEFTEGGGVTVRRQSRAGQIDWQAVRRSHLAEVDVEQFRKPETHFWSVT